ncbi:MAG: hypothetical protein ACTSO2_05025 [Promethearchaeota archaeon]
MALFLRRHSDLTTQMPANKEGVFINNRLRTLQHMFQGCLLVGDIIDKTKKNLSRYFK